MSHNGTTLLFGLRGVRVRDVERLAGGGRVVQVVTDDPGASACPACGVFSSSVRQHRTTGPRDLPYGEEVLAVRWYKVHYACREEPCPRKAFTEAIGELPAGARVTGRLRPAAGGAVGAGQPVSGEVSAYGISWPVAHQAFVAHADALLAEPTRCGCSASMRPAVAGPRGPATARPASGGSPSGSRPTSSTWPGTGLLGQTAGRTKLVVTTCLDARGQDWKDSVGVVAMDPCAAYRRAVQRALPQATVVADHFHVVRLANQAVTEVGQRVTRTRTGRRGVKTDPVWANRRPLLRGAESLSGKAFTAIWNGLIHNEPTDQIFAAWIAKEERRALLATARPARSAATSPTGSPASTPAAPTPTSAN